MHPITFWQIWATIDNSVEKLFIFFILHESVDENNFPLRIDIK